MEKIEKFFIDSTLGIIASFFLVLIGRQGDALFYSICEFVGILIQIPISIADLFLMCLKSNWLICVLGFLFFINRIIINNK